MFEYKMVKEVNEITGETRWSVYRRMPFYKDYGTYRWEWLAKRRLDRLQADEAWHETP